MSSKKLISNSLECEGRIRLLCGLFWEDLDLIVEPRSAHITHLAFVV